MNERLAAALGSAIHLYPHQLESSHPRIVEEISNRWNTPLLEDYFAELMLDQRGDRHGFSSEVWLEIFHLNNLYHASHPRPRSPLSINTWAEDTYVDPALTPKSNPE